jgi:acetyl/propionyl-CoA carboxylase alpha subunit
MTFVEVEFQGKSVRVPAVKYGGKLWFHWQGETHVVDTSGARRANTQKNKTHPGVILAPMPGKITRVSVKKGDKVSKGQTLVVMEAMKMEYTLASDLDGVINELSAQVGNQVNLGTILVRVVES